MLGDSPNPFLFEQNPEYEILNILFLFWETMREPNSGEEKGAGSSLATPVITISSRTQGLFLVNSLLFFKKQCHIFTIAPFDCSILENMIPGL